MAIKDDIKEKFDDVDDKINNIEERVRYLEINNASQTESINNIKEGLDEIKSIVNVLGNNMTTNLNSILSSINGLLTSNAKIEVAKIEKDGKVGTQKLIFWGMVVTTAISVFGTIYVSYAK